MILNYFVFNTDLDPYTRFNDTNLKDLKINHIQDSLDHVKTHKSQDKVVEDHEP